MGCVEIPKLQVLNLFLLPFSHQTVAYRSIRRDLYAAKRRLAYHNAAQEAAIRGLPRRLDRPRIQPRAAAIAPDARRGA